MSWLRSLFKKKLRAKICPNCHPGKSFPDNAILQMCKKCTSEGYDYHMFYDTGKCESFCIVSLTGPQRLQSNAKNNPHGDRPSVSTPTSTPARSVGKV